MSNVWSSQIVVKSFWVIFYNNLTLCFAFILSFDVLLFQVLVKERFYEWVELFLLIISGWPPGVNEDSWAEDCSKNFRFLISILIDKENNQEIKVHAFVIVGCRWEFHSTEIHLSIDHFHFTLSSNAYINEWHVLCPFVVWILFYCKHLSLGLSGRVT